MPSEPSGGRSFERAEAEALLPEIDALLARAQELAERLAGAEQAAQRQTLKWSSNGHQRSRAQDAAPEGVRQELATQLAQVLQRIQQLGVLVRDVATGLVDFPSLRDGRQVYLCWRRGEPLELRWWHPVNTGILGRQRLDP